MDIDITIADLYEAIELLQKCPDTYRVVSISSANKMIHGIDKLYAPGAKEILYLEFDDVIDRFKEKPSTMAISFQLATRQDCLEALDFLDRGGTCLVHCYAGISRSPAIVLGYLLKKYSKYEDAVDKLVEIRYMAQPNEHVVNLMCEILGRSSEYHQIMDYLIDARRKFITEKTNLKPPKLQPYFRSDGQIIK